MKNAEKFQEIFKEFATEVWAFPEKDFLTWLNAEYKEPTTKNNSSELEKNSKKLEKDFGELDCISRADYENRLKADMVAMLTEIQLEIEEVPKYCMTHNAISVYRKAEDYISDINKLIQQKINSLKEAKDGENNY